MSGVTRRLRQGLAALLVVVAAFGLPRRVTGQQEALIERPGPPAADSLEIDANKDGIPDGWYNARDMKWMSEGGAAGPHFVRFATTKPGRPARLSRAFGVDGAKTEAIVLGLWVRQKEIQIGERDGSEPSLMIDFFGLQLRSIGRGIMGPWTRSVRDRWTRVVKRIPVPPGTKDAIMSVGLMGATGTLDVDGLTVDLIPRGGAESVNLVNNGSFELGDPAPTYWIVNNDVRRVFPGFRGEAAIEMAGARARLMTGLAVPVEPFEAIDISVAVRCAGLRGLGGALATIFFLDEVGNPLPDEAKKEPFLRWAGTNAWHYEDAHVTVPAGAVRAVLQFDKPDSIGSIRLDDLRVTASPNPQAGAWVPFHIEDDTAEWLAIPPSRSIAAGSALDFSFLIPKPAGQRGFVTVKDGKLAFKDGTRARFFGAAFLPPAAFQESEPADQLADRLVRSGINLVRLGDLDTALGPNRSLLDDTRDDTKEFDPESLARLDHLIAALKSRGIYVAVELLSKRRFRTDDGVASPGLLPPGGGPAAFFDPTVRKLNLDTAQRFLARVNPETELALRDDPALAWLTLLGEVSVFNLINDPEALPPPYAKAFRELLDHSTTGSGRRFWESVESSYLKETAESLRKSHVRVPIAGVSHWRRESEFVAAQADSGLDLIDDRLFWAPPPWIGPGSLSSLWSLDGGITAMASLKHRHDRPYVVGQWCNQASGAWAFTHEAADLLLGVYTAAAGEWDGLVRRGVFVYPQLWGEGPSGTVGGEDLYQISETVNGSPHIYALWPHAASIFLRSTEAASRGSTKGRRRLPAAWDPSRGRLVIDTPYTQGLVGWVGEQAASLGQIDIQCGDRFAVVIASSASSEPIASTKRLLVSAIGRIEPTGYRWVDSWQRHVADPGRPPFLQEPIRARVVWRHKGRARAFVLDNEGKRQGPVKLDALPKGQGHTLLIDGRTAAFHWELTAE
ncbi:MAG: hypothetical protein ACLQIB_07445 [Isosphaeraceae bacterium]